MKKHIFRKAYLFIIIGSLLSFWACNTDVPRPKVVPSNLLIIETGAQILAPNSPTITYTTRITDGNGQTSRPTNVSWSSSNPEVATLRSDGTLDIKGVGMCYISAATTANNEQYNASVPLKVAHPEPLKVSPPVLMLFEGEAQKLQNIFYSTESVSFKYTSANTDVASVSSIGIVSARGAGFTTIRVTAISASGAAFIDVPITVNARPVSTRNVAYLDIAPGAASVYAGASIQFSASAYGLSENKINDAKFTYQSTQPSIVSVDANGKATALAPGIAKIIATCAGVSREVFVEVLNDNALVISPVAGNAAVGGVRRYDVRLIDAQTGNVIDANPTVSWNVRPATNGFKGSLLDNGLVYVAADATDGSSAYISAVMGELVATSQLNVNNNTAQGCGNENYDLDTILVANTLPINLIQSSLPFSINYKLQDFDGQTMTTIKPNFRSSDPSVVIVSDQGKLYPIAPGSAVITICIGSKKVEIPVNVN